MKARLNIFLAIVVLAVITTIMVSIYINRREPKPLCEVKIDCQIRSLARSPQGILAIGGSDGIVRLFDEKKLKFISSIKGADDDISAVSFSRDGKYIVSGSRKGEVAVFDLKSLKPVVKTGGGICRPLLSIAFSPDGKEILAGDENGKVTYFNSKNGKVIKNCLLHDDWLSRIYFSPDGKYLVTCSCDNTAKVWKQENLTLVRSFDCGSDVRDVRFSWNGRFVACANEDGSVMIWDFNSGKQVASLRGHSGNVVKLSYSFDDKFLATGGVDSFVVIWQVDNGYKTKIIPGGKKDITGIEFLAGNNIATSSLDHSLRIWDIGKQAKEVKLKVNKIENSDPTDFNVSLAVSPDGKKLATGGGKGIIRIWDTGKGKLLQEMRSSGKMVFGLAWNDTTDKIFGGYEDNSIGIWDLKTGKNEKLFNSNQRVVVSLEISPDGKYFTTGARDNTVNLWKTDGTFIHTFSGYSDNVHIMKFIPEKYMLITVDESGKVIVWDYNSYGRISVYNVGPQVTAGDVSVNYYGDEKKAEKYILAFNRLPENKIFLSEIEKGLVTGNLSGNNGEVTSVAFSCNGILASGDYDGNILLFKGNSLERKLRFRDSKIRNLAFSKDGKILASGTFDGFVIIWDVDMGKIINVIKG